MAALPHTLEQRLAALVPRVRALRVARGASACLLAAVLGTALVLALDALVALPAAARGLFIAVGVTALGVLVWRLVVRPWAAEIPLSEVAREMAPRAPELAERLGDVFGGRPGTSAVVRAALAEDAARRAKGADLRRAIPTCPTLLRASAALLAVAGFAALAGLVPNSGDRFRRIALPWSRPPLAGVRVVVTSGEPVVRRGAAVTLTAFAEKTDPGSARPDGAVLVVRTRPGAPEERAAMTADGSGAFHFTRPDVRTDFEYRVEIGGAASDWFRVSALDPVELADGSRFEVVAPAYTGHKVQTLTSLTDFAAPEFSTLKADLKFTQPPAVAQFEWRGADGRAETRPVELAPDRLSGTASVPLRANGPLALVLIGGGDARRLRTVATANVRITPDLPPWFEEVSGLTLRPRRARAGEVLVVEVACADDRAIASAVLEYATDPGRVERVTIPLTRPGAARASGRVVLPLAPLAAKGPRVLVRVRALDNRSADAPKVGPQEVAFPAAGWCELTFSPTAPALEEQAITCQRDDFHDAATAARRGAGEARRLASAARTDDPGTDQSIRIANARDAARAAVTALSDSAAATELTVELRPLATSARAAAAELRSADELLSLAEAEDAGRAGRLTVAEGRLTAAGAILTTALAQNAALARARLDRLRLGLLAKDQATLAALPPGDRTAAQKELLGRFYAILADSPDLTAAHDGAAADEVLRLARELDALAAAVADLRAAARRTAREAHADLLAEVARAQDDLAARAAALLPALDTPARLAGTAPPRANEFRRAIELADTGQVLEALAELEKQAQAAERTAMRFAALAAERTDPKLAARQLGRWQDDLLARVRALAKDGPPPEGARAALRAEQLALHSAVKALPLPPGAEVAGHRLQALRQSSAAAEALARDGPSAEEAMMRASVMLSILSDSIPTLAERNARAVRDLDPLRVRQEALGTAAEQAARGDAAGAGPKLGALADEQAEIGAAVAALDAPGAAARQVRAAGAVRLAALDLRDAAPLDVLASQAQVRRELDRLKQALEGNAPADARAAELGGRLAAAADALDAHGPRLTAKHLEPAGPVVADALRTLGALAAPEAPSHVHEARAALQAAEVAIRERTRPDEARRLVRGAAHALGRLAARLAGAETELECVQRLAQSRRRAATRAKELSEARAPLDPGASDAAARQLAREADELALTRVGAGGQGAKRRALDLYARFRGKAEPERLASDHRALAEALDELAARMADVADLATRPPAPPAAGPSAEDSFLPSAPTAAQLSDLARGLRHLHGRLGELPRARADRLRPSADNPFPALIAEWTTRSAELPAGEADPAARGLSALRAGDPGTARAFAALVCDRLAARGSPAAAGWRATCDALAALERHPGAAVAQQLARGGELAARARACCEHPRASFVATLLREASSRLTEATRRAAEPGAPAADAFRAEAHARLAKAAAQVTATAPPVAAGADLARGAALRTAEARMRAVLAALDANRDPEPAARAAAAALDSARALLK